MTDHVLPARPTRTSTHPVERWPGGAVVVPDTPDTGDAGDAAVALALNPTALALWELCDGQTAVAEMVEAVCVLFAVDPDRARADVETALRDMVAAGVVR